MDLENEEMRREKRYTCEPIEFFSVEFNLGNGSKNEQAWELNVLLLRFTFSKNRGKEFRL